VITAPLIPLTLSIFFPARIRLVNYLVLLPALLWLYVVLPLWHRSRFRWETLTIKLTYGWAHAFAILDLIRGRHMAWTATGARKREHRLLWLRLVATVWGTGTGLLLIAVLLWQVLRNGHSAIQFAPMLALTLLYLATTLRLTFARAPGRSRSPLESDPTNHEAKVSHATHQLPHRGGRAPRVRAGVAVDGAERGL